MTYDPCNALAERFAKKKAEGLIDVKFYLANPDASGVEELCAEFGNLVAKVDAGEAKPLDMGDRTWNR